MWTFWQDASRNGTDKKRNTNGMNLDELYKELRRWIEIREGIRSEIVGLQPSPGENTRRREDRIHTLEDQYDQVQRKILEIDGVIRDQEKLRASIPLNVTV